MLYQRKTFTVPATSGRDEDRRAFCAAKGHSMLDAKGRCLCCGDVIETREQRQRDELVALGVRQATEAMRHHNVRYAIGRPPEVIR